MMQPDEEWGSCSRHGTYQGGGRCPGCAEEYTPKADHRAHGEWFRPHAEVLTALAHNGMQCVDVV